MNISNPVKDFQWERGISAKELLERIGSVGYQASELKKAAEIVKEMKKEGATIFLSFTSNMASSGLRGLFAQMIERGFVDVIVTTVGSIEEDFIKAHSGQFFVGSYNENDEELSHENVNRIGNILVPSKDYESFEKGLGKALDEIIAGDENIAPSRLLRELGKYCKEDSHSILYQAYKNEIPIYCPALTDGSFGYQLQELRNKKNFQIDIIEDMKNITFEAESKNPIGLIILGGGVAKHHAILANLTNGGADYAVYMTTASHYSGSLSGATTEEAKSWGKIKTSSKSVTVHGEVSILFPLLVSYAFEE